MESTFGGSSTGGECSSRSLPVEDGKLHCQASVSSRKKCSESICLSDLGTRQVSKNSQTTNFTLSEVHCRKVSKSWFWYSVWANMTLVHTLKAPKITGQKGYQIIHNLFVTT